MRVLEPLVDRLVPQSLHDSIEQVYRARILILVSLSCTLVLVPFCIARYLIQGIHAYPIILSFITAFCSLTPLILRFTASIERAGIFFTLPCCFGFAALCVVDGGLNSPTLIAIPIIPLLGIFFAGFGLGLAVFAIFALMIAILALNPDATWIQENPFDPKTLEMFWAASVISACVVLISMAYFFVQWQQLVRERLLAANRTKDEFLSGMSHEIRTPLNSIVGFADSLMQGYSGELNEKQSKYVSHILRGSEHLSSLVDDFLDLTAIEEKKIELARSKFDVKEVLEDCAVSLNNIHKSQIKLSIDESVSTIEADETRFRQIVLNLLGNAQKFSPSGEQVILSAVQREEITRITVEDNGPGIPKDSHKEIFEKFYQANDSLAGKTQGSGLGLFISKQLCDLHGGELFLDQNYHQGARFVFSLPTRARLQ